MNLSREGSRFVLQSHFLERTIPKKAGFQWDARHKRWETDDVIAAARLVRYADDSCEELLAGVWLSGGRVPQGTGTRWVEQGQGATVADLERAFGYRSAQFGDARDSERTCLGLTGEPMSLWDRFFYDETVCLTAGEVTVRWGRSGGSSGRRAVVGQKEEAA